MPLAFLTEEEYAAAKKRAASGGLGRPFSESMSTSHTVPKGLKSPRQGEPGYTPNEMDFCGNCYRLGYNAATFQPDLSKDGHPLKSRYCPQCGCDEGRRRSFHQRTRLPYLRSPVVPE